MSNALLALHFQNDICHPQGRIPFSLNRNTGEADTFLDASRGMLALARQRGWTVAHVHIGFADDYSDLPRNCRLFNAVETLGAVKRGSWGAAPFTGFEPQDGEIFVTRNCNSGFRRTNLDEFLRARGVDRIHVMGLATQFSVEHTVRDAADLGYIVTLIADCCASADREAHRATLRVLTMLADIVESRSLAAAQPQ